MLNVILNISRTVYKNSLIIMQMLSASNIISRTAIELNLAIVLLGELWKYVVVNTEATALKNPLFKFTDPFIYHRYG